MSSTPNKIKTLLISLDGVILDVVQRYYDTYYSILSAAGHKPLTATHYWILKREGLPEGEIVKATCPESFVLKYETQHAGLIEDPDFLKCDGRYPGALGILEILACYRAVICLAERKNFKTLECQLRDREIWDVFKHIITTSNFETSFESVKTDSALVVSDSPEVLCLGVSYGLKTCGILGGRTSHRRILLSEPSTVVSDITYVPASVENLEMPAKESFAV